MNRTIVITGASSGIGAAAARRLAAEGDQVVVVGRDERRTNAVADEIGAQRHLADFSKLDDVRALAADLNKLDRIDVLANNAGGMFRERTMTVDGFESTFQVNHLAGFLLTQLLHEKLVASGASVIQTSSAAHYRGRVDLDDLQLERKWTPWRAYCNVKLMNLWFTRALHYHWVLDGVHAAAFHPGVVSTSFGQIGGVTGWYYASPLGKKLMVTPEQGADPLVWLAQGRPPRDWQPGAFYVKHKAVPTLPQARDAGAADVFWRRSLQLAGLPTD